MHDKDGDDTSPIMTVSRRIHMISSSLFSLQKVNRRLHLSKSKNTKFNESGQLCVFHLVSSVWGFYILITVSEIGIAFYSHWTPRQPPV